MTISEEMNSSPQFQRKYQKIFLTYAQAQCTGSYLIWYTNKIIDFDGDIFSDEGLKRLQVLLADERGWPRDQVVITFFSILR